MIVIEGMDNSGKSTLAREMAEFMDLTVKASEGKPKSDEEINERVDRYNEMTDTLFDRHPCVSNAIYGKFRGEGNPITPGRTMLFYERTPTLIYCDAGDRGLAGHLLKDHDTLEHMANVESNYYEMLKLYRIWAAEYAHFIYRIGDDMDQLIRTVTFYQSYKDAD